MRTQKALQLGSGIKTRAQVGNWPLFGNSLICLSFFLSFLDGNFGKFIVRLCYLRLFLMLVKLIGD